MSTIIILIRHGQTISNLKKIYCGITDTDLNNRGIEQAKKAFRRLQKEKIHRIYSSDAKRALNFARIAFRGLPIEKIPELREMNFGIFEGLPHKEIMKKYPKLYTRWLKNPFYIVIPNSESLNDFKKRVKKILAKIISLNRNKTSAIVTHAGPIKIIISDILKSKDIWKIEPSLASLSIIEFNGSKAKTVLLNDTSYLDG